MWHEPYESVKAEMKKALVQMQTIGKNKQFANLLGKNNELGLANPYAIEITSKMMMLFHPKYNYIDKLTTWTAMGDTLTSDGYKPFVNLGQGYTDYTRYANEVFVNWLQARALALYEIVRGI